MTFDDLVLRAAKPAHRLEHWVADLVGEATAPLVDISGGLWRDHRAWRGDERPPVHAWQERRKFLLRTASGPWLIKFAGLGRIGLAKLERGRILGEAGFSPMPAGWRHGFLVEPWREDARAVDPAIHREPRIARLAEYLGFRARTFADPVEPGATVAALFAMARHNAAEAFGEAAARRLDGWRPRLDQLEARRRPVETDNRLQLWEWLDCDGRLVKTDALDHHVGHDLIGAQDVAWDVAGGAIEFGLSAGEADRLASLVERESGTPVDPDLLAFCGLGYLAFQLGYYDIAMAGASGAAEAGRLAAARDRYADLLRRRLSLQ